MIMLKCGSRSGSVSRAERNIKNGLQPRVRNKFTAILEQVKKYLKTSTLALCAPASELWITVKVSPHKAVIAFRNDEQGYLHLDIDTYGDNDISDKRGLFQFIPNESKPNKRHVCTITPTTSEIDLDYFIQKVIEGMRAFE
jgi:hypothetical protein